MSDRIRSLSPTDLDLVCRHRESMFAESGRDMDALKPMTDAFRDWLRPRLDDRSYFGWIIERDEQPIAGLGMMIIDWPPHPSHPTQTKRGYVLNMYVEPGHRRRGLAKRLMAMARAEAEALELDYVTLHATEDGRPLYESIGWVSSAEMGLHLKPPIPIGEREAGRR